MEAPDTGADGTPIYRAGTDGRFTEISQGDVKPILKTNFGVAKVSPTKFLSSHHGSGKVVLWENFKPGHVFDVPMAQAIMASREGSEFLIVSQGKAMIYSLKTFELLHVFNDWPEVVVLSAYDA